ncbi:MAG: class I tRNA ligase family protein, partial [Thermoanaerobaculia bacterium]
MALEKYFEPRKYEQEIYRRWEESGAFRGDLDSDAPAFVISMPPPNATGTLHTGHAVMLALEDLMTRWRRMCGDAALWVPGTDHAAIATESVVIKNLQAEGIADPRGELGREELLRRIADYVAGSRDRIREQIRAMGSSCDWSRERYTMDPQLSRCVNATFARMFRDGLIYRGPRIVNWDPYLQTTVSDDEIYHQERPAKFYTLRYGPFLVGTSRPETKLGDTAVAVHPDDERFREHVGKTYEVEWPSGPTITVRVVADEAVDPETGTGAVGVTPAHSHVDFDIAQRHDLPLLQVIGEDGRMTDAAGPTYAGMTVEECRQAFVAELESAGLLAKVEDYSQSTSLCYRSKKPIEPLPKEQWFIDVNRPAMSWEGRRVSLKQVMREVVRSGAIRILPEHQERTYFHWIDNLRDWCISRQIWWGHRIPVWYRGEEDIYVGHRPPAGDGWRQDEDTL